MNFRFAGIMFFCLTLGACSAMSPYHRANSIGATGYHDQKIDDTRFHVTFTGNASTPRETVEDYLLYRSAELTVENGYDYFVITEKDTETKKAYTNTLRRPAFYGRNFHSDNYRDAGFPYYAYGYDWGYPHNPEIHEITRYSAIAYIAIYKGPKPLENPRAFTAKDVISNLTDIVCAGKETTDCPAEHSH